MSRTDDLLEQLREQVYGAAQAEDYHQMRVQDIFETFDALDSALCEGAAHPRAWTVDPIEGLRMCIDVLQRSHNELFEALKKKGAL